jgi:hypothetical protein
MPDAGSAPNGSVPLDIAVKQHADCPCERHHKELLDALANAPELIFKAVSMSGPVQPGTHEVAVDEHIQFATATIPQGGNYLLGFPHLSAARRHDADAPFLGMSLREVVRAVQSDQNVDGVLLTSGTADDAWTAIDRRTLYGLVTQR